MSLGRRTSANAWRVRVGRWKGWGIAEGGGATVARSLQCSAVRWDGMKWRIGGGSPPSQLRESSFVQDITTHAP